MQPLDKSINSDFNIPHSGDPTAPEFSPPPSKELREPPRYLLCNEAGQSAVLSKLTEDHSNIGGTHIGFALWMNLDIISITKAEQAVIADFDTEITSALQLIKDTVIRSKDRLTFVDEFIHALKGLPDTPDPFLILGKDGGLTEKDFRFEITGQGWLSSDEQYEHVRSLYTEGKIYHTQADITDPNFYSTVKEWLSKSNSTVTTAYTSNIGEWILQNKRQKGLDTMAYNFSGILDAKSVYIDAQRRSNIGGESPKQRITLGNTLPGILYSAVKRKSNSLSSRSFKHIPQRKLRF